MEGMVLVSEGNEKLVNMQIKVISVPVVGGEAMNEELNKFLQSHKILQVEQQLVNASEGPYWSFCIRYTQAKVDKKGKTAVRKDYREILSEEVFGRFAQLRNIRLQLAKEDGVPAFALFTNEELAGLAALEKITLAGMRTVKGVGEKKTEKYGERLIKALANE